MASNAHSWLHQRKLRERVADNVGVAATALEPIHKTNNAIVLTCHSILVHIFVEEILAEL